MQAPNVGWASRLPPYNASLPILSDTPMRLGFGMDDSESEDEDNDEHGQHEQVNS